MKYYVYIIRSCIKNKNYIGCTTDYNKRLKYHNSGKNKSTRLFKSWKIIHIEEFDNKNIAYKREWYLKHPEGYIEKIKILKRLGIK